MPAWGSYNIRKFNSMGGRAFIVTQSIKKLGDTLKQAVFNDFGYRLLSDDRPVKIEEMKGFDKQDEKNSACTMTPPIRPSMQTKRWTWGCMKKKCSRTER